MNIVVYDASSHDKTRCCPVFRLDAAGVPTVTNDGRYYKNVRKEWASLVSTPSSAAYQDALAFTRSMGDLHLHAYGVTHYPEVHRVDLACLLDALSSTTAITASPAPAPVLCVVLATDGVWDNWLYEDVTKFVIDGSSLNT